MPAKSGPQYRFMQWRAHTKGLKSAGPSPEVAKEFIDKTPVKKRKLWARGGK